MMPISRTTISNNRGFSLIELTVVVFVIALMASLSYPLLNNTSEGDLRASGKRLASVVKYLYNEAVLTKLVHRLTLDLDRGSYNAACLQQSGEWTVLQGQVRAHQLPQTVEIAGVSINGRGTVGSGQVSLQIYPAGWVDETVLYLVGAERELTVRVSALTGTAEFFDGHREFK